MITATFQVSEAAEPWIGLVAVSAVVLGFVGWMRGAGALMFAALGTIAIGLVFKARLEDQVEGAVTQKAQAGMIFISLGVSSALVLLVSRKRSA